MELPKITQAEGLTERIMREAKQFAFYNYCSAAHNPDADFDNIETWPSYAKVAYYSISNYMSGNPLNWPFTDKTTIPMDLKNVAFETALQQWNAPTPDRPCPHCGKQLSRDRNLCCECGKEVIVQPKVDLGKCRQCDKPATKDYNNHEYNVCDACYDRLNSEFDREYN